KRAVPLPCVVFYHGFTSSSLVYSYFAVALAQAGFRVVMPDAPVSPRRNNVSHGDAHLLFQRIFWQVFCSATLFLVIYQFAAFVG
ncbi:hypothetical protein MJL48_32625, partial [Salmonella enterica subsp. enterica serovar Kentucky]|nr:hypothetical protein [Salmonella enterica subsp. enterica serovar Kentucky]